MFLGFRSPQFLPFSLQHTGICEFPSQEFYQARLNTWPQLVRQDSVFYHRGNRCCPVIFGHVEGKEQSLIVSTEEGNENSKANLEELEQAVRKLLGNCWRCRRGAVVLGDSGSRRDDGSCYRVKDQQAAVPAWHRLGSGATTMPPARGSCRAGRPGAGGAAQPHRCAEDRVDRALEGWFPRATAPG